MENTYRALIVLTGLLFLTTTCSTNDDHYTPTKTTKTSVSDSSINHQKSTDQQIIWLQQQQNYHNSKLLPTTTNHYYLLSQKYSYTTQAPDYQPVTLAYESSSDKPIKEPKQVNFMSQDAFSDISPSQKQQQQQQLQLKLDVAAKVDKLTSEQVISQTRNYQRQQQPLVAAQAEPFPPIDKFQMLNAKGKIRDQSTLTSGSRLYSMPLVSSLKVVAQTQNKILPHPQQTSPVPQANNHFFANQQQQQPSMMKIVSTSTTTTTAQNKVPTLQIQARNWLLVREELDNEQNNSKAVTINLDDSSNKCRRRNLNRLFAGARSLVTGAFEQYATPGNLVLGSGLLAAAVPLAALILPEQQQQQQQEQQLRKRREDKQDSKAKSGIGSLPASAAAAIGRYTLQGRVDSVMGWIERSVEHLPNFPRLHPQECVKRSICEAHNEPDKYGAIGFILRLFFPATNLSVTDRMDDMEYKVINKYRHAAGFGLNKRLDNNNTGSAACREKYEDCLVSLLDVAQNLIDIFLK